MAAVDGYRCAPPILRAAQSSLAFAWRLREDVCSPQIYCVGGWVDSAAPLDGSANGAPVRGDGMLRKLKRLGAAIVIITTFVAAVGGLILAFGKTYDEVCEFFPCPPRHAWVDSNPITVSQYIKSKTTFVMPSLKPADPTQSPRRYVSPPTASCAPAQSNAWKLKDGTVILENDPLLVKGWISPSWVGQPEPPDWSKFDNLAKVKFGWTPGFANNNRCSAGARCKISPDEIKKQSTPVRVAVDRCSSMYMGQDANYSPDGTSMSISILGEADAESLWSVVVPTQTYEKVPLWSSVHFNAGSTK